MKVDEDGNIRGFWTWGSGSSNYDSCQAVSYDESMNEVVYLLQATSSTLRPDLTSSYSAASTKRDLVMIRMTDSGNFMGAININFQRSAIDFYVG
jgi:hypothetical protein